MIDSVKWIYVLEEDFSWDSKRTFDEDYAFVDSTNVRRLEIRKNGEIRVLKEYAWDGCTPKIAIWDIVFGTPDGVPNRKTRRPKTYYASLLHDALYQFLACGVPLSRREIDRVFLDLMTRDSFGPRYLYYAVVRLLGGFSLWVTRWKRKYNGRSVPI